jgi:hypothetical protein
LRPLELRSTIGGYSFPTIGYLSLGHINGMTRCGPASGGLAEIMVDGHLHPLTVPVTAAGQDPPDFRI